MSENDHREEVSGADAHPREDGPRSSRPRRLGRWFLGWLPFLAWLGLLGMVPYAGRFPTGDSPHILGTCMRLGWCLRSGQPGLFIDRWLGLLAPHPPGAYLLPTVLYALVGVQWYVPWLCGAILLALIWDAILRMMKAMEVRGAWGVALMLAAAPLVWSQVEVYGIDLASAAAVAQCLSHLMASRGLTERRSAIFAGAWLGVGFWLKYTFPVFLFVPCLAVIAGLGWDLTWKRPGVRARVRNGFVLVVAALVPLGPLGVLKGADIVNYVRRSLAPTEEERALIDALAGPGAMDVSSLDKKLLYVASLKELWGWPGLALLVAGLVLLLVGGLRQLRRQPRGAPLLPFRASMLGLVCALSGLLFLSTFAQKVDRYMLPAIFPLAAVLIPPLSGRRLGAPLVLIAMAPPALYVFADYAGYTQHLSFDQGPRNVALQLAQRGPAPGVRPLDHPVRRALGTWGRYPLLEEAYRPYSADPRRWKIDTILTHISHLEEFEDGTVGVYISPALPATHLGLFLMRAERLGFHWTFVTVKLRRDQEGGLQADLFQAPFVESANPTFQALVVLDRGGDLEDSGLISSYLAQTHFREEERMELGHARIRILTRKLHGQ